ncbi:MAG: hypothetical protein GXY83_14905 [Rhodopirellula sp.]|nr:hypothetical protein [Rhodopirellula sp.]
MAQEAERVSPQEREAPAALRRPAMPMVSLAAQAALSEAPGLQVHQPWEAQEALRGSVPRALRAPCRHRPLLHSTRALSARSTVARQRNNPA